MPSNSETGHAKNIANFQLIIDACTGYGPSYKPSDADLALPALNTKKAACAAAHSAVKDPLAIYGQAVGDREALYATVDPLTTSILNMFQLTDAPANVKKSAKTIADKIRGANRKRKSPPPPGEAPEANDHSTSQRSFVMIADNFESLISIVKAEPTYNPAEDNLKVAVLETLHAQMLSLNTTTDNAFKALNTVRTVRNQLLYATGGLVDTVLDVKKYVKAAFGSRSSKYKEISGLEFRRIGKRPSQ